LRHLLLTGEYEVNIDDKFRLNIPAEIRKRIIPERDGKGFYIVPGLNKKPWLYAECHYENMVGLDEPVLLPEDDQLEYDQYNFALTTLLELDPQGRLAIPARTFRRMEMSREITLIGVKDHLEIWNRAEWEQKREELIGRSAEVTNRMKRARRDSANGQKRQDPPPTPPDRFESSGGL
jgi:MraZ protein